MKRNKMMMPGIVSAGYDALNEILELEFQQDGQIWQFYDVPENVWYAFRKTEAVQTFYHTCIIGKFRAEQII